MEWVVLETDAYPQPFKKQADQRTEPRHTAEVAAELARLKGLAVEEVAEQTTTNALAMFGALARAGPKDPGLKALGGRRSRPGVRR
jgi:Tat protein secretion system quality control protein TatD with DNase activity